jgi:putative Ca2+/H+ antiporter (TMEM165/GDT1 family)
VSDVLTAIAVSFGVMFLAELGDKTQLLALNFGARHSLRLVAVGLTLGYAIANIVATVVGGVLGATLPERPIEIVGGLIFLGFAVVALRNSRDDESIDGADDQTADVAPTRRDSIKLVASVATTIAVAEMGDKTQIATATLASQSSPVGVWIGATLGAASSGMVGAVAGNLVGDRIPTRALHLASAALFALFGVAMLAGWF